MEAIVEIPALIKVVLLFALVSYFAGSFHVVRLFVAHRSAMTKWEPDRTILITQFTAMERSALFLLTWPMLVVFFGFGLYVLWIRPDLLQHAFMHVLFGYFALLLLYQIMTHRIHTRLKSGEVKWSALQLRAWAWVATLFLFTFVVLLILREHASWVWGAIGLLTVGGVALVGSGSLRSSSGTTTDA